MTTSATDWTSEDVRGWGMAVGGRSKLLRPTTVDGIQAAFAQVRERRGTVALRGSGCSYGDAAICTGGHVLDLSAMNRILAFDPVTGIARVEPGVTIRDLWRHAIGYGFWPAVVPGTMRVSVGGACAMNIHGKNNWCAGPFGEWVRSFKLLTPRGEMLHCSRDVNPHLFHGAISGFGMLGCFTEVELQLKRVHSGRLKVWAIDARDLAHQMEQMESLLDDSDYLVSWVDLHAKGTGLGRGVIHRACQYEPGEDPQGLRHLDPCLQDVPDRMFGIVPKGWLWPGMWMATHGGFVPFVNALKYHASGSEVRNSPYPQTHGAFHFLLDYVPRWHWMTKPGGLVQFQPFLPKETAEATLRRIVEMCHRAGIVPYLGVLKRHRPDPFLMTHAVDGWSMAMDFAVSSKTTGRERLWNHCRDMAEVVLDAGGRFYYAKDAMLLASSFPRIHGADAVSRFRALKGRCDPDGMLQTDLSRRMGVTG